MNKMMGIVLSTVLLLLSFIQAENLGPLEGILNPTSMKIHRNRLYVLEGQTIHTFSLDNLRPLGHFGREGEGPGEIKKSSFYTCDFFFLDDRILVDSLDKLLFFSREEGKFLNEQKKRIVLGMEVKPVGNNFVVKALDRSDGKTEYHTLSIYNSRFEKIREIFRQISPVQLTSTDMVKDPPYFCVIGNRIFIDDSPQGLNIKIFDREGVYLGNIKKSFQPVPVTESDRNRIMEEYKSDPLVRSIGFENLKSRIKFKFARYFPPIQSLHAFEGLLCVETPVRKDNKTKFLFIKPDGQTMFETWVPPLPVQRGIGVLNGTADCFYAKSGNDFYYMKEDDETWTLNRIPMK
jgi:hypothetical protein